MCCVRVHSDAINRDEKHMAGIVERYQDLEPGQLESQVHDCFLGGAPVEAAVRES